jgi:Xaa-Pro aminopeptidase
VLLAVLPDRVGLILPKLEMQKLAGSTLQNFAFGDNPAEWQDVFQSACQEMGLDGKKVGVEPNRLRFMELEFLQKAAPKARFVSAAGIFDALRIQKDADEVAKPPYHPPKSA